MGFHLVTLPKYGTPLVPLAIKNGNPHTWHGASGTNTLEFALLILETCQRLALALAWLGKLYCIDLLETESYGH